MASLSELWDENKYSENDPVRQLIAVSKAYKDWPMDAVAWGADLVDLGSSGLAKIFQRRPEFARMIKTDLGGNLRRAIKEPRGELGMSEGPAPDLESGRSLGRMLNPAFLLHGDVPGWGAASKALQNNRFSEAKRQFILGKNKAFEDKANENIYKPVADILTPIDEIAQTPVDRRKFLQGSAAIGAAAAGGGLLKNFGRIGEAIERAPEALRGAKIAEEIPKGWESTQGGAYRYHSLKDYLDDVEKYVDHTSYENGVKLANKHLDSFDPINPSEYDKFVNNHMRSTRNDLTKQRLLDDETAYKEAKRNLSSLSPKKDPMTGLPPQSQRDLIDSFSPQAKKEMKELKQFTGDSWVDNLIHGNGLWSGTGKYEGTLRVLPDAPEAARVNEYFGTGRGDPGYRIWLEAPDGGGPGYKVFNTMDEAATNRSIYMYELLDKFK